MKTISRPEFQTKEELFDWLIENKSALLAQKKSQIKHADSFVKVELVSDRGDSLKSESIPESVTKIKVRAVINTTKLFDSHDDVHIDGLWKKSIKETKDNYLVKQHDFTFEGIISDNVKVFTKSMTWADLGYDFEGNTEALIYEAVIDKSESPFMFEKYRMGKVKQHSVGMRYVKIEMAINDSRYEKEFSIWEKYFSMIANKKDAEQAGYFFAVTEAKNIEGSAVVRGSNFATPTISVTSSKNEPPKGTQHEPDNPLKKLNELLNTKNIFN